MMKQAPYLKKGDKIAVVCPAKMLRTPIDAGLDILRSWGLEVLVGATVKASYHQFAGTDPQRTADLQRYLDDPEIKAIIAGRGGYGTIRLIDDLDFTAFSRSPKWLVGFSDITVLLSHTLAVHQIMALHAQMPYTFTESTAEALDSLRAVLFGEKQAYHYTSLMPNKPGNVQGTLIGGNLSLLQALEGSVSEMDFRDKILFIEDVGEHEYAIDRMMRTLKRKGKLKELKALIVGGFTELGEEPIPFGQTPEAVIGSLVEEYGYPVCYQFPVGHIPDNRAMLLGAQVRLDIGERDVHFQYI